MLFDQTVLHVITELLKLYHTTDIALKSRFEGPLLRPTGCLITSRSDIGLSSTVSEHCFEVRLCQC